MELTLISHALCPYVQRAVIALEEKGARFKRIDIDLAAKPDWFLDLSPLGKTPLLRVGQTPIFESAVICEYLEDTIAPALHPADPVARARHRSWIEFASATLNGIWSYYTARDTQSFDAAAAGLIQRFAQLERQLGDGTYFDGRFSLVDAAFAPVFRYFDVFDEVGAGDLFRATPKVREWRRNLAVRPSVRKAVTAEYASLLREFVIRQGGILGQRFEAQAAVP
jgi:glutathione S-transferase